MLRAITEVRDDFLVLRPEGASYSPHPWKAELGEPPCPIVNIPKDARIAAVLEELNPSLLLVNGYYEGVYRSAAFWGRTHGIPVVLNMDTWHGCVHRNPGRELLKMWWARFVCSGAFVPGQRATAYAHRLGFRRIWKPLYVIDIDHFAHNSVLRSPSTANHPYFLTVSRLSPEKNIVGLLRAFGDYRAQGGAWDLVIAGTGPQEDELKSLVLPAHQPHVHWLGWVGYQELPTLYQTAGCFVLASKHEPWGQVVSEAMAAGAPLLVSEECGCTPDLCHPGGNGYVFHPNDTKYLTELMHLISGDQIDRVQMAKQSRTLVQSYHPSRWANAVCQAVDDLT